MAFILLRYSVYSSLKVKLLLKEQFIFGVLVYNQQLQLLNESRRLHTTTTT